MFPYMRAQWFIDTAYVSDLFQITVHPLVTGYRQDHSFFRHSGCVLYFSKIIRGMSNSGMSHMLSVFSRAFLIQYSPLTSFIMCSYRKCCTSVKASPVSAQNTNMSLTVCRRGMVNSFFRSMFNSSSVRNARFVFVCLK